MGDINNAYSDYNRFVLKSDNTPSYYMNNEEPGGWSEDSLELDRHADYHGIFYTFTNNLKFYGEAKDYILNAYKIGGLNTILRLTKEITRDLTDVKWDVRYYAIGDFNTMVEKDNYVTLQFNSNDLAEILKSFESDDFEIETLESIDGDILDELEIHKTALKGRSTVSFGESALDVYSVYEGVFVGESNVTPHTKVISEGPNRHGAVTDISYTIGSDDISANNMIYVNAVEFEEDVNLNLKYSLNFLIENVSTWFSLDIYKVRFVDGTATYEIIETKNLVFKTLNIDGLEGINKQYNINGEFESELTWEDGLLISFRFGGQYKINLYNQLKSNYILNEIINVESSVDLDFVFVHDLMSRLMYILTNRKDAFYSKYFGRTELGYAEDDINGGLIGVMSGLWARAFDKNSEKYKSLTISPKDALNSIKSVFNVGIGIETNNFKERLRVEDLKYFYQNEVVIKLPYQVQNVERKVDASMFFSGLSFGYDKSGDYEDSLGLDEPNSRTDYITPVKMTSNKFVKTSKIRTDEYGLELARRKPQLTYPDEDTRYDEGNWFLDLKRTDGNAYTQVEYQDRLQELPYGVYSPKTYRSMFFTPLRMLFRHAWIFRAGMELYQDKYIKFISSISNSNLTTFPIGWDKPYREDDNIKVEDLDRSRMLPEIITCEHHVDDALMDLINGTTSIKINGEYEEVPNYYFKFEFENEKGEKERGYLMNLKPVGTGKFTFQKANENLI